MLLLVRVHRAAAPLEGFLSVVFVGVCVSVYVFLLGASPRAGVSVCVMCVGVGLCNSQLCVVLFCCAVSFAQ